MTDSLPRRICFPFVGDSIGGSHVSALLLIGALDRRLFEPVIVVHQKGQLANHLKARNIHFLLAPEVRLVANEPIGLRVLKMLRCGLVFRSFLRTHRIDIVHTNDARMHLSWGLAARFAGAKFVWHQRTKAPAGKSAFFALMASKLLVISEFCRLSFSRNLAQTALTVLNPVGAPLPVAARVAARKRVLDEISAPDAVPLIAFVGNMQEQKRPFVFVEAAQEISRHYDGQVRCLMFGEEREPITGQIRHLISQRKLDSVCLLMGARFPIEPWLAACNLVLAPAAKEGFGRVLVEAMLTGTPVIASDDAGHKEIIEQGVTGVLVPLDDPVSMAAAAIGLLDDNERAGEIAQAAQETAGTLYAPSRHARTVETIYRDLLGEMPTVGPTSDLVFVIHDMGSGGAQRVALNLINGWMDRGRKVHVLTWLGPETDFFHLPQGVRRSVIGSKYQRSGRIQAHLSNIRALFLLRRCLRLERPGAVVSFLTVTNLFTVLASIGLKCRTIVSERNDPTRQNAGLIWSMLRKRLYRLADVVTANSRNAVEAMRGYVPRSKLAVVENPIVLPVAWESVERSEMILSVGRLVVQKNHRLLIEALSQVEGVGQQWHLEIAGEGDERLALTRLAERLDMSERVSLPGTLADLEGHYRSAGIFVLSSLYEGMPNVLLEAMAYGLPCVVSDSVPGALEYVEDNVSGLVFRSGDAAHLAERLSLLINQPRLRQRLGDEARNRMNNCSLEKVIERWDDLLFPEGKAAPVD